ncbi:hypothetical protein AB1L42_23485 [Thalassoglobus sp. JC818]|uniref:hypothetical protein n=1 Tax=Thalassoglobus sp. JC818 TaxID=3232136 RepID=UPI00345A7DBC
MNLIINEAVGCIAIPLISIFAFKNTIIAILASSAIGVPMLVWRMLYLETNAPDSDMDIIFALAMLIWSLILIAWYTVFCVIGMSIRKVLFRTEQKESS